MSASIEKSFPPNDKKPPQDAGPFPGPAAASFLFVPLMLLDYVDESGLSVREEVYYGRPSWKQARGTKSSRLLFLPEVISWQPTK